MDFDTAHSDAQRRIGTVLVANRGESRGCCARCGRWAMASVAVYSDAEPKRGTCGPRTSRCG